MHGAELPLMLKLHNGVVFGHRANAICCFFKSYVTPSDWGMSGWHGQGMMMVMMTIACDSLSDFCKECPQSY
jgi:hypothetical protein